MKKIDKETEVKLKQLVNSKEQVNIDLFFTLLDGMGFARKEKIVLFVKIMDFPFGGKVYFELCDGIDVSYNGWIDGKYMEFKLFPNIDLFYEPCVRVSLDWRLIFCRDINTFYGKIMKKRILKLINEIFES